MEKALTHTDFKMEITEPEFPPGFRKMYPDYFDPYSSFEFPSLTTFYERPPEITERRSENEPEIELKFMKDICNELRTILEGLEIYGPEGRRIEGPDRSSGACIFFHLFWEAKTYMETQDGVYAIEEPRNIVVQRRIYLIESVAEIMKKRNCSLSELGHDLGSIQLIGNVLATIPVGINIRLREHLENGELWKTDFKKE